MRQLLREAACFLRTGHHYDWRFSTIYPRRVCRWCERGLRW